MKKETIITAVVFLIVGFFIGWIAEAQFNWNSPEKMAATTAAASTGSAGGNTAMGSASTSPMGGTQDGKLPPGHPSLEVANRIKELEDQATRNPQDPQAPLDLANFYYDQKQYDRAANWYEKALALDPKNVNARTDLGTVYFSLGRADDALKAYQESLRIDPNHEPTMFNTIIVNLEGTHDLKAARAMWDKLHKRNPNYPGLENLKDRLSGDTASGSSAVR